MRLIPLILTSLILTLSIPHAMGAPMPQTSQLKNIILLIADGMGYNQTAAGSLFEHGRPDGAVYHGFPVHYAMSNHMIDGRYDPERAWEHFDVRKFGATDSAASATTKSTGYKTYAGSIGLDVERQPLRHAWDVAKDLGKSAGVVSSVQFAHATPASFVAYNESRANYGDIARQMVRESRLDVIMGAGHPYFDNNGQEQIQPLGFHFVGDEQTWLDINLGVPMADSTGDGTPDPWTLVTRREVFQALAQGPTPKRVLGIPQAWETLRYNRTGHEDQPFAHPIAENVPTLDELTRAALNVLDNNPEGFVLMIEGGAVDWAGHANYTTRLIEEQIDFDNAAAAVVEWVEAHGSWDETLVIVTSDHETGYLTGPDAAEKGHWTPLENKGAGVMPGAAWHSGGHTNIVVPLYAKGAGVERFKDYVEGVDPVHGVYVDNTAVGRVIHGLLGNPIVDPARNVILMVSDGMGYAHVEAASLYEHGRPDAHLFHAFPVQYGLSTYMDGAGYDPQRAYDDFDYVRDNATDSAAAGTAMSTGFKTYAGAIGVDPQKRPLRHASARAKELGRAAGVVSSVQFSHATPASFVAHNESRNNYEAIANQMIRDSSMDVIIGAGHPFRDNNARELTETVHFDQVGGMETWRDVQVGRLGADSNGDGMPNPWTFITRKEAFVALAQGPAPERLLGVLPVANTLQFNREGDSAEPYDVPLNESVPTLAQASLAALNVLGRNENGLFLMIEGGAVDWAGHANHGPRMIEEQLDFVRAVEAVHDWVEQHSNWDETLLIVTSDHETGYLTSPDAKEKGRPTPLENRGKGNLPGMAWHSGGHTNALVPLYAKGQAAALFSAFVQGEDPLRGAYIDITAVGRVMFTAMEEPFMISDPALTPDEWARQREKP